MDDTIYWPGVIKGKLPRYLKGKIFTEEEKQHISLNNQAFYFEKNQGVIQNYKIRQIKEAKLEFKQSLTKNKL